MATIKDVARVAGVAVSTVSATLNESAPVSAEVRRRVRAAIAEVDYAPDGVARSLRKGTTQLVGLVVSDIANPFFAAMTRVIEKACNAAGYGVVLYNTDEDVAREADVLRLTRIQRVAGLILAPAGSGEAYAESLRGLLGVPTVTMDRRVDPLDLDSVLLDNRKAARLAVEYLLRGGHRRIAAVAGRAGVTTGEERLAGYREAHEAAGLAVDEALVRFGNFRQEDAYETVRRMMAAADRPSAFFALNNLMTIGTMRGLTDMGFVCPDHVSVAGIDDFDWATAFRPRLTTIAQPIEAMGRKSVELLMDRLAGRTTGDGRREVFEPRLCVRDSCAPVAP